MSDFLKLKGSDFIKGAITAALASALMTLASIVNQTGFDLFTVDWHATLNTAISSAVAAFVGYIAKNLLTDSQGMFLGKI